MVSKLIVSINRSCPVNDAEEIANLAIECSKMYPDVVGIEISGNPMIGKFADFIPALDRARAAGLRVRIIFTSFDLVSQLSNQVHRRSLCEVDTVPNCFFTIWLLDPF